MRNKRSLMDNWRPSSGLGIKTGMIHEPERPGWSASLPQTTRARQVPRTPAQSRGAGATRLFLGGGSFCLDPCLSPLFLLLFNLAEQVFAVGRHQG